MTHRGRGHFEGDAQKYRLKADQSSLEAADPLIRSARRLKEMGCNDDELKRMKIHMEERVAAALLEARNDTEPDFAQAFHDVNTLAPRGAL